MHSVYWLNLASFWSAVCCVAEMVFVSSLHIEKGVDVE